MNRPPEQPVPFGSHEEWELHLQDWLDGSASPADAAAVESHIASCAACAQLAQDLRALDRRLAATVPAESALNAEFDARIRQRIAAEDAARQRARNAASPSAPQDQLEALSRATRRSLLGIAAIACVLVVALAWLVISGTIPLLSPATIIVTVTNVTPLQWLGICLTGGATAAALARALQST